MRRRFHTLDVFTDTPFAGNPLAVVLDCDGLTSARMQQIAREFALSETVFVLEPHDPVNTARIRIFTPKEEMPFAGHPTIGAAILIAQLEAARMLATQHLSIVLEEGVGPVNCTVRQPKGQAARATFALPKLPERREASLDAGALAACLDLDVSDIGFDGHEATIYSAGNAFTFVPVNSLAAMARARPMPEHWAGCLPEVAAKTFLYTRDVERKGSSFHARMFAPTLGIIEDPATGSAVAAFAGVIGQFEKPADGEQHYIIEQGFEMGRPSMITLSVEFEARRIVSALIGGAAVRISEGVIDA